MRSALFLLFFSPLLPSVSFFSFIFQTMTKDERVFCKTMKSLNFWTRLFIPSFFPVLFVSDSFSFRIWLSHRCCYFASLLFLLRRMSPAGHTPPNKLIKRNGERVNEKWRKEGTRFCLRPLRSFAPFKQPTGSTHGILMIHDAKQDTTLTTTAMLFEPLYCFSFTAPSAVCWNPGSFFFAVIELDKTDHGLALSNATRCIGCV